MSDLTEKLDEELEHIISYEGDAAVASGFRMAVSMITKELAGKVIVPVEPSTRRVQWAKFEALNNIKPHHEGTLNHFVEFYKAMLSTVGEGDES